VKAKKKRWSIILTENFYFFSQKQYFILFTNKQWELVPKKNNGNYVKKKRGFERKKKGKNTWIKKENQIGNVSLWIYYDKICF
jgi:predicted GH43/DUF377 family glycosyl hydrolase